MHPPNVYHIFTCQRNIEAQTFYIQELQSGASSRAKIGGDYFSDGTGSFQNLIAVPGPCEVRQP